MRVVQDDSVILKRLKNNFDKELLSLVGELRCRLNWSPTTTTQVLYQGRLPSCTLRQRESGISGRACCLDAWLIPQIGCVIKLNVCQQRSYMRMKHVGSKRILAVFLNSCYDVLAVQAVVSLMRRFLRSTQRPWKNGTSIILVYCSNGTLCASYLESSRLSTQ